MAITAFFTISVCAEITALLMAIITLFNKQKSYWFLFVIYLIITLLVEAAGFYKGALLKIPNHVFYNFLMIVQVLFFTRLFYDFIKSDAARFGLLTALAVFILFFIGEGVAVSFSNYHGYSRMLLSCFVVIFSCIFYFSIIRQDNIENPLRYAPFWIVTGLFVYYFGSLPLFAFIKQIIQIKLSGNISFYTLVTNCLSCILYGCWITGFICRKRQHQ
jgi:hypothetical protein